MTDSGSFKCSFQGSVILFCIFLTAASSFGQEKTTSKKTENDKVELKRPNIVFIFSDDHANHAIGAYDGWLKDVNPTPNIDALARRGMLFQNSFCTNSICGPSRAVILTGKHSHKNGFRNNGDQFDGDQPTFPKMLRSAGYSTAMIGKWHLKTEPQGFDYWDILRGQGDYYNPVLINKDGDRTVEGYCTDIVTDLAIDWLKENVKSDKPFMLMCQHKAPHRTWMPPKRYLTLYDDVKIPEPKTLFDRWEDNAESIRWQEQEVDRDMHLGHDLFVDEANRKNHPSKHVDTDESGTQNKQRMTPLQLAAWDKAFGPKNDAFGKANLKGKELVRWKYNRYIRNYLRCVRTVDDCVGRITKLLNENGIAENTIVIYSSDQGFYLGDHGWFDKRLMYEESLKMPLIVSWPGVTKPGTVNKDLVQNLDYAETFLEMARASIPDDMQGRSLVPLLKGETVQDWRKSIYYHYYAYPSIHMIPRHFGIRTKSEKLIKFYHYDQWEYYDLQADPDELTNQYKNEKHSERIAALKNQLVALQKKYEDDSDVAVKPQAWQDNFRERAENRK